MQTTQKSDYTLLKYILILLSAIVFNIILCRVGLLNWNFIFLGMDHYVQSWTQDIQPVDSLISVQTAISVMYWMLTFNIFALMAIGVMLSPFLLAIILLLYFFKQSWLPKDNLFLFKVQDYWTFTICLLFALVLLLDLLFGSLLHTQA